MCRCTGQPTSGAVPIRFGTYNINNGRNGGLESALRRMSQTNMDLGIFQEKKVAHWSWMCQRTGPPTSGTVPIRFGTYNICNRRNGSLYSALRGMFQDNMDLGIFQEMK